MKVLVLTNNYPKKNALYSGIFIHRQVKALQQLGVECHVLLLHNWFPPFGLHRYHPYWREGYKMRNTFFEEYEGVKIHAVPMFVRMPGRWFKESYYHRAARAIIKFVTNNSSLKNAGWLYAHFLTDNGYIAAKIKDKLNVKLAAIARGDDIHAWPENNPALRKNFPLVFQKADLLMANSKNLAKDVQNWMVSDKIRAVEVVYNGIDYLQFRPATSREEKMALRIKYKLAPDKKYLVCIAAPVVLKGWIELLHAIKILGEKFNGWALLMIAPQMDTADAIDLEKKGEELGIEDKLVYMGRVLPADLAEVLRASDAFVLPSYNEGMANSLLEAMATGLACITTNVGGHNEVIENKDEGVLIAPRSVPELVNAISVIIEQDELRETMGIKAREKMIIFGDYLQNGRKLLALLKTEESVKKTI